MDFGYDGEELGYEAGYEKSLSPSSSNYRLEEQDNGISIIYHTQTAPLPTSFIFKKPTPSPSVTPGLPAKWEKVEDKWNAEGQGKHCSLFQQKQADGSYKYQISHWDQATGKIVTEDVTKKEQWTSIKSNAGLPPAAPGAPDPNKPVVASPTAKEFSMGEKRYKEALRAGLNKEKGDETPLTDGELDTYINSKFPKDDPKREQKLMVAANAAEDANAGKPNVAPLPTRKEVRDSIDKKSVKNLWDASSKLGPKNQPGEGKNLLRNNLEARGWILDGGNPPNLIGRKNSDGTKKIPVSPEDRVKFAEESKAISDEIKTGKLDTTEIRKDTERRQYLSGAWENYRSWATAKPGDPKPPSKEPDYSKGLGLTEADAKKRFDKLTIQLKLTNSDGSPTSFDPEATGKDDPAQAFFPVKEGESRFNDDGTVKKHVAFQHENPTVDDSSTNPVTKVAREGAKSEGSRNILYYTLTGQQFDPGHPVEIPKDTKVMDPPLTRAEALAYMHSKGMTDGEGNPLPGASSESFMNKATEIQKGELGPNKIKYDIAKWERQEIAKTLANPPYSMKPQEITRYMHSKGWLGDQPNVESMEAFRKKAVGKKGVEDIKKEVKEADVKGNDPLDQTEKDRAEDIKDNLAAAANGNGKDNGSKEARAGRETSKEEGAASRDTSIKVAKIREEGEDKRARDRREFDREEKVKDRDFQANQEKLKREHDSAERAKDRANQLMMSLIQFIGSMLTGAMQAMTQISAASISGQQQMAGQIIGGMRGGRP